MRNPIISTAIFEQRVLQFSYHGQFCLVEPHAYGESADGGDVLIAWQRSPAPSGWKLYRQDKMDAIDMGTARFKGPRSDYKRGDKAIVHPYAAL